MKKKKGQKILLKIETKIKKKELTELKVGKTKKRKLRMRKKNRNKAKFIKRMIKKKNEEE